MTNFFNSLKNAPAGMSYENLSNYYAQLMDKVKNSNGNVSDEDLTDLNLISNIFETPEHTAGGQKIPKELINKKLFEALAGSDKQLSYDELISLKNKDYEEYKKEFPNKTEFYNFGEKSLSTDDISKFQKDVLGWKNPLLNKNTSLAYFDNNKNYVSADELTNRATTQLDELKKLDIKFKDKNGKEVDVQNVIKTFEQEGYKFRILSKEEQEKESAIGFFDSDQDKKEIVFNPSKMDLSPKKGVDKSDKVSDNFAGTFLHELMHYWDLHENYQNSPDKFQDVKAVIKKESYAEDSSTRAIAAYKGINPDEKLKDYSKFEQNFLKPYKKENLSDVTNQISTLNGSVEALNSNLKEATEQTDIENIKGTIIETQEEIKELEVLKNELSNDVKPEANEEENTTTSTNEGIDLYQQLRSGNKNIKGEIKFR
jgi:hypothetical protein